mgnify:CR=1 FL=1|tara:strand:- start:1107 stop:1232 length:126 start_codon:yes stop_codon:yes gene_type:complete
MLSDIRISMMDDIGMSENKFTEKQQGRTIEVQQVWNMAITI